MPASSHTLDRIAVTFDDDRSVADARLILTGALVERLGLETLVDDTVTVGYRPGRKLLTHTLVAGGDCIDDVAMLRAGATARVLGHDTVAASTVGSWLRQFTFGHVRQLDRVTKLALSRAWAAGAGPGDAPMFIDLDSTICEAHGYAKQGAAYGYTRALGLHPLVADWRHHAFVTNRPGDPVVLDVDHRAHAVVELAIRDLKHGAGMNHCPSGIFNANAAWLVATTLAHNLVRWTQLLGVDHPKLRVAKTLRRRLLSIPGRITRSARRLTLHLPTGWPWRGEFEDTLRRLRAIPAIG